MQDFLERLGLRLTTMASDESSAAAAAANQLGRTPRRRRLRRPALLGGVGATSALAAALLVTGTSAAELPILQTAPTDVSAIKEQLPAAARAGVDFSAAHAFGTPAGPGYVLLNKRTDTLCLATPDPGAPGTMGAACARPIAAVERRGLAVEAVGDRTVDPDATNLVSFILPERAEELRLASGGKLTTPELESGVAVFAVSTDATLSWTIDGRRSVRRFEGPLRSGGTWTIPCPDGRYVPSPAPATTGSQAEQQAHARSLARKACRR